MKYYIDTEFIEKVKKPWFGKPYHFLQLISIGIVCEDGREYYAVNSDFDRREANSWVRENVISKLPERVNLSDPSISPREKSEALAWKPMESIRREVAEFLGCWRDIYHYRAPEGIQIWAYYADYDWVLFCSIFGAMIDLPTGLPMYCLDLKQEMDRCNLTKEWKHANCPEPENEHNALEDARWNAKLHKAISEHILFYKKT